MKRLALLPLIAGALALAACGGTSSNGASSSKAAGGGSSGGHTTITVWQGYTDAEATAIKALASEFNASHPNITVNVQFSGNNDYALQKVLAAIAGGKPPGHRLPLRLLGAEHRHQPAGGHAQQADRVGPELRLERLLAVGRKVATVGDKIVGIPALVDNLASSTTRSCSPRRASPPRRPPGRGRTSRTRRSS